MTGRILFLIPARSGSRRLPGKNLLPIGGIPLVGRAARTARRAAAAIEGGPHAVVCSTDAPAISETAATWGADALQRPAHLATAEATSVDVAVHALETLGVDAFETIVLLQPTSPLTDPVDVVAAVGRHRATGGRSIVSVAASHPAAWHHDVARDGELLQGGHQVRGASILTGAFYVSQPKDLLRTHQFVETGRTLGHLVTLDRSVDVDEAVDMIVAEALLAARPVRPVSIGQKAIGDGSTYVIAEAGVNHNGRPELAHRLVDAAADAGADAVKFQTFDPAALAAPGAERAAYQVASGDGATDQRDMLAALVLPRDTWAALQAHAHARGIEFLSSPFDDESVELLERLGVPAFKVGSGELTNLPFIARVARYGRPLIISTGMASMNEVADAVDTVVSAGDPPLVLLHCVSNYPAEPADADLRAIETMRRAFEVPVGWSDHMVGIEASLAAAALGAAVIEKHLTLDRELPGPDHRASLEPDAFRAMTIGIRVVEDALGNGVKTPAATEADIARVARRSLHWRQAVSAGTVIELGHLEALRPGTGIEPARMDVLVGRRTTVDVRSGDLVRPTDVEGIA